MSARHYMLRTLGWFALGVLSTLIIVAGSQSGDTFRTIIGSALLVLSAVGTGFMARSAWYDGIVAGLAAVPLPSYDTDWWEDDVMRQELV